MRKLSVRSRFKLKLGRQQVAGAPPETVGVRTRDSDLAIWQKLGPSAGQKPAPSYPEETQNAKSRQIEEVPARTQSELLR